MKKLLSLMLALMLTFSLALPALATEAEPAAPQYTEDAESLFALGLFKGVGTDEAGNPKFNLEGKCTRVQALVILLRLLGLEEDALATTAENPFTDMTGHWAEKYTSYAYSVGLTNGVGNNKFDPDTEAKPIQFATFILRALGYDDAAGDFDYFKAVDKARELSVVPEDMFADSNELLRDSCVKICVNALKTNLKDTERTLAKKLIEDGVIDQDTAIEVGVLPAEVVVNPEHVATVEAAYALKQGAYLSNKAAFTLTGVVTAVNDAYSSYYKNVSVTISVPGCEDKPIYCWRLQGTGADEIAVGYTITVTGKLTNYNGTIEFDKGCTLDSFVPAESSIEVPTDPTEIVDAAYALDKNMSLPYKATLTGTIVKIDEAYSSQYKNITLTIVVDGRENYPILCYRLQGEGADQLAVGDVITVTGSIKNYEGLVEFPSGCTFVTTR